MVRVDLPDGEQVVIEHPPGMMFDIDIGPSGTLTLRRVSLRWVTNPQNVRERTPEVSNPQFVRAWGRGAWSHIENLELDRESRPDAELEEANHR